MNGRRPPRSSPPSSAAATFFEEEATAVGADDRLAARARGLTAQSPPSSRPRSSAATRKGPCLRRCAGQRHFRWPAAVVTHLTKRRRRRAGRRRRHSSWPSSRWRRWRRGWSGHSWGGGRSSALVRARPESLGGPSGARQHGPRQSIAPGVHHVRRAAHQSSTCGCDRGGVEGNEHPSNVDRTRRWPRSALDRAAVRRARVGGHAGTLPRAAAMADPASSMQPHINSNGPAYSASVEIARDGDPPHFITCCRRSAGGVGLPFGAVRAPFGELAALFRRQRAHRSDVGLAGIGCSTNSMS